MSSLSLKNNNKFRRLVAATAGNELSQAMTVVTIPLLVLGMGGSATTAGIIVFSSTAAAVISQIFAGALTDRFTAGMTFRISLLVQLLAWGFLGAAVYFDASSIVIVLCVVIVAGAFSSLGAPSEHALVKSFVSNEQLGSAAAVSQGREAAAGLLGGPLGGALMSFSAAWAIWLQSILHLFALVISPSQRREDTEQPREQGFLGDVVEGFTVVISHRGLRIITIVAAIINLPISALPLALISYYEESGINDGLIGIFASSMGVGAFLGSLVAGWLTSRIRVGILGFISLGGLGALCALLVLIHPWFGWTCVVSALAGFSLPAFNSAIGAYTIAVTPESHIGRVVAATGVPGMILMPLGPLMAGLLFDNTGINSALGVIASLSLFAVVVALMSRDFRELPMLSQLTEQEITGYSKSDEVGCGLGFCCVDAEVSGDVGDAA
ncbi:MAG: MFS transporter [Propionibacteriaceae bacterium]|nr:MFS transporter [Propionibacteriaceae bacterium]